MSKNIQTGAAGRFIFFLFLCVYIIMGILDFYLVGFIDFIFIFSAYQYVALLIFLFVFWLSGMNSDYLKVLLEPMINKINTIFAGRRIFFPVKKIKIQINKSRKVNFVLFLILLLYSIFLHVLSVLELNEYFLNNSVELLIIFFGILAYWGFYGDRNLHFAESNKNTGGKKIIFVILIGAFLVRLYNLDYLYPAGDEYRHLLAMKHYFKDGFFEYRVALIPTYILIFLKKVINTDSLFLFRLPFVIMGTISVGFFYLIGKKLISSRVGLIAAFLFAFLPLSVGLSRYIRGYEFEMLFTLIFIYLCLLPVFKKSFYNILFLAGSFMFLSSFDNGVRIYASIAFFLLFMVIRIVFDFIDLNFRKRLKKSLKVLVIIAAFFTGIFLIEQFSNYKIIESGLDYLFVFNYKNFDGFWFLQIIPFSIIVLIFLIPLFFGPKKMNNTVLSLAAVFAFILFFYIFMFDAPRRIQTRYIYNILPYYILLASVGLNYLFTIFKKRNILAVIVILLIFNPFKTLYFLMIEENGMNNRLNDMAYFNVQKLTDFVDKNNIDITKIITNLPWIFDFYYDGPFINSAIEKKRYVHFPANTNWYDFLDRTKIHGVNAYWTEGNIRDINNIISSGDIDYLIFSGLPNNPAPEHRYGFVLENIPMAKPMAILDGDKSFGFYLYKVEKIDLQNT